MMQITLKKANIGDRDNCLLIERAAMNIIN